ncbi:MAG: hypothetical protein AAGF58_07435 [Pseudomonadota bacterium]
MSISPEPLQLLPSDEYEADETLGRLTALTHRLRDSRRNRRQNGVRVDLGFRGQRFVAPWNTNEQFFRQGTGIASLEAGDPSLQQFVAQWANGPLCYGYPNLVNKAGHVLPLLYCDVRLRISSKGTVQVELDRDSRPQINPRIMVDHCFDKSLTDDLIDDLVRRDFDSFDACLEHLAGLLGLDPSVFSPEHLLPWPIDDRAEGWRNTPILFAAVEESSQTNIADELLSIETTIQQAVRHTALHAFFDPDPGMVDRPALPLEPFVADSGNDTTLEECLDRTLSYLTAPPGTGRLPFIGNLIASQIVAGGSVLFISPHGHVIDQVAGQMDTALQRNGNWIHRLERRSGSEQLARSLNQAGGADVGSPSALVEAPSPVEQAADRRTTVAREHLSDVAQQLEALYQAQWRFSVARMEAAKHIANVDAHWHGVFDLNHEIGTDQAALEQVLDRARSVSPAPKKQGLPRLLGRTEDRSAFDEVLRDLVAALSRLPASIVEPIEVTLANARDANDPSLLVSATEALLAFLPWKAAMQRAEEAYDAIVEAPDRKTLVRHFGAAQAVVKKTERGVLAEHWNARITANATKASEVLRDFLGTQAERGHKKRPDEWLERKLAQIIRDSFAAVPLWTGRVENVVRHLPLEPALFDLVIIEDPQCIDAGALFPLLYRARQAVVIGTRSAMTHSEATAAGLLAKAGGCYHALLRDCARSHPSITRALSLSAHAGNLRAIADVRQLTHGINQNLVGIHWHQPADQGEFLTDPQLDRVLSLVTKWREEGLFDLQPPRMVGVACPCPIRRETLMEALPNRLPKDIVTERIAVAGPERFHSQVVDFLIVIPVQDGEGGSERASRLAQSGLTFHDAVAAAKIGVHFIGDPEKAKADGGLVRAFHTLGAAMTAEDSANGDIGGPVQELGRLMDEAGVPYSPVPRGLLVHGPLGTVYEFVVPGAYGEPAAEDPTGSAMRIDLVADDFADPARRLIPLLERLA